MQSGFIPSQREHPHFLSLTKLDLNSDTPTGTSFFVSYSTQSSSARSTSWNVGPPSVHLTIQPVRGEKSTGSRPRQSNWTIVFSFPESFSVYEAERGTGLIIFLYKMFLAYTISPRQDVHRVLSIAQLAFRVEIESVRVS